MRVSDEELIFRRSGSCSMGSCVEVATTDDGGAVLRDSKYPDALLRFDPDEWAAFLRGVVAGEFGRIE